MDSEKVKEEVWRYIEENAEGFVEIARKIWENPELGLQERFASDLQTRVLEENGFRIKRDIGGMPTAFIAEYGSGRPIIGVLGEYDALPGLSQKAKAQREPVREGAPGHGCGHNLLGTAGVAAAIAVKKLMEEGKISGTLRYYGCPAEETLVGKVYMAREGVYNDLDAVITWHPMLLNAAWTSSSLAMISVRFEFKGIPAHAAASPEMGRSALDAAELMNVGANYLREHVPEKVRIHYSILYGGKEPNIVPDKAVVWYYIRAPDPVLVEEVFERMKKIAQGAAYRNCFGFHIGLY
ncbi:MAG: amidohydrolase [Zestosphaera sp.]